MASGRNREPLRQRIAVPALIAGVAAVLTALGAWGDVFRGQERFLYDLRLRGTPAAEATDRIVPIAIDDASVARLGRWPWPRPITAGLARDLGAEGARVVMIDLTYDSFTTKGEDDAFVAAMRDARAAVFAYSALQSASAHEELTPPERASLASFERRIPVTIAGASDALPDAPVAGRVFLSLPELVAHGPLMGLATLDKRVDDDGVVRRVPLVWRYEPGPHSPKEHGGRRWLPSLNLLAACRWYGVEPGKIIAEPGRLILPGAQAPGEPARDVVIPVDSAGRMLIRYARSGVIASRFQSVYAVLNALGGDPRGRPKMKDRIAVVYTAQFSNADLHDTPLHHNTAGGLINAEALNTILTGQFVGTLPPWATALCVLLEGVLLTAFAARWTSYRLGVAWLTMVFFVFTGGFIAWRSGAVMVDLAPMAAYAICAGAAVVVWRTWLEDRERVDLLFALRALQNQAIKERHAAAAEGRPTTLRGSTGASMEATDALKRNVEYGRFIESLRDIESLENTYIGKHYRLLNLIDEGGMGLVFRAYDEALDRVVAIKVLTRYSTKLLKRFQTEAKAVGQLHHPNVVQIFAVASEGDIPYIVMEYVPGTSLSQRIRDDGPLPIVHAAEILLQIARGLDAAHLRQIVHRDIKTSNVLIAPDGTAKIIDFGIAKVFKGNDGTGEGLTGEKEVVGTADYMSPEQGSGRPVDARSDIYSLGITLYRILTGRLPFRAEDTVAVLLKQMREALPDIRQSRPDVPNELIAILKKMTEKLPEDRYQTCQELCVDLEAFLHAHRARESGSARAKNV